MKKFANLLVAIALIASGAASLGCPWFVVDEPKAFDDLCD